MLLTLDPARAFSRDVARLRGNGFINIRSWIIEHHGSEGWAAVRTTLTHEERETLDGLQGGGWYPLALQAKLLREVDRRWGDNDLRLARTIGTFQARRDLDHGVLTWLFRLFQPSTLLGNMDVVWRRFHDSGRWEARVEPRRLVLRLFEWKNVDEANCADVEGYLEQVGQKMSRSPGTMHHPRCTLRGAECCEFIYEGSLDRRAPIPRRIPDLAESSLIGRELLQVKGSDTVCEAIGNLLRQLLPRDGSAALWVWEPSSGRARLLWSCGQPSDAPAHCLVLECGGQTFGRLEVDAIHTNDRDEVLASLGHLVPWFGIALAQNTDWASAPDRPSRPQGMIVEVSSRWRLTPRQTEVLSALIEGLTNKEIAARLGCSEATVEVHVTALLRKSGASNRTGLVRAAMSS